MLIKVGTMIKYSGRRSIAYISLLTATLIFSGCDVSVATDDVQLDNETSVSSSATQNPESNTGNNGSAAETQSSSSIASNDNSSVASSSDSQSSSSSQMQMSSSSQMQMSSSSQMQMSSSSSESAANATQCSGTTYGPRELKLLTREEYQNTMEDLVGIDFDVAENLPFDNVIEGYFNNAYAPATDNHGDAYLAIAEKVSQWSAEHKFQGVVDCGFDNSGNTGMSNDECMNLFFKDFGTRAFRRPLTVAEREAYADLFKNNLIGGDIKVGLKLAMTAMLTSPQFLYRSEVGTSVEELKNASNSTTSNGDTVTLKGSEFATKSTGGEQEGAWNIWSEGYIENSFDLADTALFQISMKGSVAQNGWPIMELVIDGSVVATQTVDSSSYKLYEFSVEGHGGTHKVQIRFTNDLSQNGEDRNLYVESLAVSGTQAVANIADTIDLSKLDSDAYVLSDYEVASFLSYTLTGSMPDETLFNAAKNGELASKDQQRAQIARLLGTDRAKEHMGMFAAQWLGSDEVLHAQKDTTMFPDFTNDVRVAMAAETKAFFTHVFFDKTEGFTDLFNANYVMVNKPLAQYYGLGSVGTDSTNPNDFVKVDSSSAHRGGLMTLGAFLANDADLKTSSPIKRAADTRIRVLCQDIPQPDDTIPDLRTEMMEKVLAELEGKEVTTREFVAAITKNEPCNACHDEIINPLGFSFEDYDASGRYITTDHHGLPVDSTGRLYGVSSIYDGDIVDFVGGKDLSNKFAELDSVGACFSANVFRYAMDIGHDAIDAANKSRGSLTAEEKEDYQCSVNTLSETLATSNSMAELFTKLGTLDLVRFRKQRDR